MSRSALGVTIVLGLMGCAGTKPAPASEHSDLTSIEKDVAKLREQVARMQNEIGHLKSEVSAASAEGELAEMTIDGTTWSMNEFASGKPRQTPLLLCHVAEWSGFGKMLRFTRMADQTFLLEADGQPPIHGYTGEGGMCNDDGSVRCVMLSLTGEPAPGVAYRLRPQNTSEGYRWKVTDDVVVIGE